MILRTHLVIPDTQCKPNTPTKHLSWVGKYIVDYKPDVVVHLGDHWDMASLSSYSSKKELEGARYNEDIQAGNDGLDALMEPLRKFNKRKRKHKEKQWRPRLVLLRGNHEERILRYVGDHPGLESKFGYHEFNDDEWEVHDFLEPVLIDGITYSHYFYNHRS